MIRDFQYNPSYPQLAQILQEFNLDFHSAKSPLNVLRFEVLSPDSFAWKLLLGSSIYYLYAEDYISGLEYLKRDLTDYIGSDKWDFVPPKQPIDFESSSPVKTADVYEKPEPGDDFVQYAVTSGHDFVFLVKTLENPDDAHFPERNRK